MRNKSKKELLEIIANLNYEINDLHTKLEKGRHYLMSVQSNEVTVEDALEGFGFGRNGLRE